MAGGDLLFILAFIILPTAVLVSCVWALVLLRKGVLLPARPTVQRDISQKLANGGDVAEGESESIEETGEHEVIAVPVTATARAKPGATASGNVTQASEIPATQPVIVAPQAPLVETPDMAAQGEPGVAAAPGQPPPAEQTQEMEALQAGIAFDIGAHDPDAANRDAGLQPTALTTPMLDPVQPADPAATAAAGGTPDLLLVPLDEPVAPSPLARQRDPQPANVEPAADRAGTDRDQDRPTPRSAPGRSAPARRIARTVAPERAGAGPRPRTGQRRTQPGQES